MVENESKIHFSLRTLDWRFIKYTDGSIELYDHRNDPLESINLADSETHRAIKRELEERLHTIINN